MNCKEIKPVNLKKKKKKKNQLCIFIGRNEDEDEAPILWPLEVKSWIIGKDYDTGKD